MTSYRDTITKAILDEHPHSPAARISAAVASALADGGWVVTRPADAPPPVTFIGAAPLPRKRDKHQWTRREFTSLAAWVREVAGMIATHAPGTWDRTADHTPGLSAGVNSAVAGGRVGADGAQNGRTQAAALKKLKVGASPMAQNMHLVLLGLVDAAKGLGQAMDAVRALQNATPKELAEVLEPDPRSGAGECSNVSCGAWCSGEGRDRKKKGLCPACYAYRARRLEKNPDASPEDLIRPHEACHPDPIDGCRQCARRELLEQGHAPDEVVGLVDERTR